jgi:hypothetical protein
MVFTGCLPLQIRFFGPIFFFDLLSYIDAFLQPSGLQMSKQLYFTPSIGDHWIRHKGHWLRISRVRHEVYNDPSC